MLVYRQKFTIVGVLGCILFFVSPLLFQFNLKNAAIAMQTSMSGPASDLTLVFDMLLFLASIPMMVIGRSYEVREVALDTNGKRIDGVKSGAVARKFVVNAFAILGVVSAAIFGYIYLQLIDGAGAPWRQTSFSTDKGAPFALPPGFVSKKTVPTILPPGHSQRK